MGGHRRPALVKIDLISGPQQAPSHLVIRTTPFSLAPSGSNPPLISKDVLLAGRNTEYGVLTE